MWEQNTGRIEVRQSPLPQQSRLPCRHRGNVGHECHESASQWKHGMRVACHVVKGDDEYALG
jgi:hypothetical protein